MIVKRRDAYFLCMIFLITPTASIHTNFYNDRYDSLSFIATVATTVAVSKLAYDAAASIDQLPKLYNRLFSKQSIAMPTTKVGILVINDFIDNVHEYIEKLYQCKEDPFIQGLIVVISSSGGLAGPSELLYRQLREFGKYKPIVVYIEHICLSAGYMVAAAADHIMSTSSAIVGSIGSLRILRHFTEKPKLTIDNEEGLATIEIVASGKYKGVVNFYKPLTDEGKKYLQDILDKDYDLFCRMVADARGLSYEQRTEWAEGKEFIADPDGLRLGLVDSCGSFDDAQDVLFALIKQKNPNANGPLQLVPLQV